MGQDPHRTPERPAGFGAGNKPRAPLRKRRRTLAHHTRRHPVRRGPRATRGRKRKCAVHLQGAGSPTLRRCRHRRERAHRAARGKAPGIRERRGHRRHLLHQGCQGTPRHSYKPTHGYYRTASRQTQELSQFHNHSTSPHFQKCNHRKLLQLK